MTWYFRGEPVTSEDIEGFAGFVYRIIDKGTGKQYIGKKLFVHKKKLKPLKGKVRPRRKLAESDWQKYYGSNDILKAEVKARGPDDFHREILHLCRTKKQLSYHETKEQFLREVLEKDGFYNSNIAGKFFRVESTDVVSSGTWSVTFVANSEPWRAPCQS